MSETHNQENELFLAAHTKVDEKKVAYYVCFKIKRVIVAMQKFDTAIAAWKFIHSARTMPTIPFDYSVMHEFRCIKQNEIEIIADPEPKEETPVAPAIPTLQSRCTKCASYYEPMKMCKVIGAFVSDVKACTAFQEPGKKR